MCVLWYPKFFSACLCVIMFIGSSFADVILSLRIVFVMNRTALFCTLCNFTSCVLLATCMGIYG